MLQTAITSLQLGLLSSITQNQKYRVSKTKNNHRTTTVLVSAPYVVQLAKYSRIPNKQPPNHPRFRQRTVRITATEYSRFPIIANELQ